MAILAVIAARNVLRRFTGRDVAVVAAAAAADGLKMIDAPDGGPIEYVVTILALVGGEDVVGRFRCRFYKSGLRVTGNALARRAGKHAADVAGTAVRISV